jgi:hypothetical protein
MAGAALSVGVLAAAATIAVACASAGAVSVRVVRLSTTADAVALAAADTASGAITGTPCARAAEVARRDGASLDACDLEDAVATIAVGVRIGPVTVRATARAGPPPGRPADP